jgi:hypothetical protein
MKQFCPTGHDTFQIGRTAAGVCRECNRAHARAWRRRHPDVAAQKKRKWVEKNRDLVRAADKRRRVKDPARTRQAQRLKVGMRGVPLKEPEQGALCDCCQKPMIGKIYADHDHKTGLFRGWVHPRCNLWLAGLDAPGWLASAAAYLSKTAPKA